MRKAGSVFIKRSPTSDVVATRKNYAAILNAGFLNGGGAAEPPHF
jgi:hypothetical protein